MSDFIIRPIPPLKKKPNYCSWILIHSFIQNILSPYLYQARHWAESPVTNAESMVLTLVYENEQMFIKSTFTLSEKAGGHAPCVY